MYFLNIYDLKIRPLLWDRLSIILTASGNWASYIGRILVLRRRPFSPNAQAQLSNVTSPVSCSLISPLL